MSRGQCYALILMLLAAVVTVLQLVKGNSWPVIISYWAVLTLKNLSDLLDRRDKR